MSFVSFKAAAIVFKCLCRIKRSAGFIYRVKWAHDRFIPGESRFIQSRKFSERKKKTDSSPCALCPFLLRQPGGQRGVTCSIKAPAAEAEMDPFRLQVALIPVSLLLDCDAADAVKAAIESELVFCIFWVILAHGRDLHDHWLHLCAEVWSETDFFVSFFSVNQVFTAWYQFSFLTFFYFKKKTVLQVFHIFYWVLMRDDLGIQSDIPASLHYLV